MAFKFLKNKKKESSSDLKAKASPKKGGLFAKFAKKKPNKKGEAKKVTRFLRILTTPRRSAAIKTAKRGPGDRKNSGIYTPKKRSGAARREIP